MPSPNYPIRLTLISREPFQAQDDGGRTYLMHEGHIIYNELLSRRAVGPDTDARLRRIVYALDDEGRADIDRCLIGGLITLYAPTKKGVSL